MKRVADDEAVRRPAPVASAASRSRRRSRRDRSGCSRSAAPADRCGGLRLLGEKPERDERLREAVVGQQLDRRAAERSIDDRRSHAVVHRIAPGRDRAPHRLGLRRPQRRQVQHGALVDDARRCSAGGRRPRPTRSPRAMRRRTSACGRARPMPRRRAFDRRLPTGGRHGGWRAGPRATIGAATDSTIVVDRIAALIRPPRRPRCASPRPRKITAAAVTERRADEHPIARDRIEHVAEPAQVEPHQRRAAAGRDRAQPRQQPHAQPPGRQHFHREDLPQHDQRVERDRQVGAVGDAEDRAPAAAASRDRSKSTD